MTRKSKREIERKIDDLDQDPDDEPLYDYPVAKRMSDGWETPDGEPIPDGATILLATGGVTIPREEAERRGCEIIEPADDLDGYVVVPLDYDEVSDE